jgi:hypothetical protein
MGSSWVAAARRAACWSSRSASRHSRAASPVFEDGEADGWSRKGLLHALFVRAQCCTRMRSSASAAATAARTNGVAEASYRDEIRKAREPPRRRRPCKGVAASGSKLGDRAGDGVGLRNQRAGANRDSSRCVDKHSGQFIAEGGLGGDFTHSPGRRDVGFLRAADGRSRR